MALQPDIVVVLSDQQRPDTIGAYGQVLPTTPVLDELARSGTTFDNAFTVAPVCGPARAAIQSGRYPTDVGVWRNGLSLTSGMQTLATRLASLGYVTGYVGKWHLASDRGPALPGSRRRARFEKKPVPPARRGGYTDAWVASDALELTSGAYGGHMWDEAGDVVHLDGYRVDAVGSLAVDRLRRLARDERPFLLFVSFLEPHHQNDRLRTIAPRGWSKRFRDFEVPGDLVGTLGDWRWNHAASLAASASIDENLGWLIDALGGSGRERHSLVVYSSDHGSHYRTRNTEYKRSCHDASIRVPLIIAGPGFGSSGDGMSWANGASGSNGDAGTRWSPGSRDGRLVTHLDLVPTLVTAAGGADPRLAGEPLQVGIPQRMHRVYQAEEVVAQPWRDEVLIQISESQIGRALRTETHTFAAAAPGVVPWRGHLRPSAGRYVETHLYDLRADPFQRHNLAGSIEHGDIREELAYRLASAVYRAEGHLPAVELRNQTPRGRHT